MLWNGSRGRQWGRGLQALPSHWHPGPDLRHPCHFSEPLRQGARHPEVLSQQGSPSEVRPSTA